MQVCNLNISSIQHWCILIIFQYQEIVKKGTLETFWQFSYDLT